jgi:drug/metabolite transporter (DMT)-like permease
MIMSRARPGIAAAVGSALLFGVSTPLAKLLLEQGAQPQWLAATFYLGSGVGLGLLQGLRLASGRPSTEAPLRGADWPRLALALAFGGVLAPVLLFIGIARTTAASAALLLNLEGVATMAIAWLVLRENVDRRIGLGAAAITLGALALSFTRHGIAFDAGSLYIAAACLAWGIDNNLTRFVSNADPLLIALVKGLAAGAINLSLALALHTLPLPWAATMLAMCIGFLGYGVSLVLFVRALRDLGTARTSAYFATAPFIGAVLGLALFHEPLTGMLCFAALCMGIGLYLHLSETHEHEHVHEPLEHEHSHVHDDHHHHEHADETRGADDAPIPAAPHTHWHRHEPLRHRHRHYPDLHHRHGH